MVFLIYRKIKSKSSMFFFPPPLLSSTSSSTLHPRASSTPYNQRKKLIQTIIQQREHTFLPPAAIDITTITTRAWNNEIKTNTQKTTSKYNENQKNNENQKIIFKTTASLLSFFHVKTNKTILRINRYRRA